MESFKIVDVKQGGKDKPYYYCVLYSNLGYLCNAYLNEDDYNYLKNVDYYDYDLTDILVKKYNKSTQKFSYYINLNK